MAKIRHFQKNKREFVGSRLALQEILRKLPGWKSSGPDGSLPLQEGRALGMANYLSILVLSMVVKHMCSAPLLLPPTPKRL